MKTKLILSFFFSYLFSNLAFSQFEIHSKSNNPFIVNGKVECAEIPKIEIGNYSTDSISKKFKRHSSCQQNSYGIVIPKPINICSKGKWTQSDNCNKVLLLSFQSDSALGFQFVFKKMIIPKGGKLLFYDLNLERKIGAFTHVNNPKGGFFSTRPIFSNHIILEYQSDDNIPNPELELSEIVYVFDNFGDRKIDFGLSNTCHENVNCPPWNGMDFCREIRATVKLLIRYEGDSTWEQDDYWAPCSGVLINNVNDDFTPYILTAGHCVTSPLAKNPETWTVYYNFQSPECTPNTVGNDDMTTSGIEELSTLWGGACDDISLLRVTSFDNLPLGVSAKMHWQYNVFYAGWTRERNRNNLHENDGLYVHHPLGDVKKADQDVYDDDYQTRCWEMGGNSYAEDGSSGGPLFDGDHRVLGVLTATLSLQNCDDDLGKVVFTQLGNTILWDEDDNWKYFNYLGNVDQLEGIDPVGDCQPKLQLFGNFFPGNDWQAKNDITIQASDELEFSPAMLETHILGSPAHMATNHTSHYNFKAGERITILPGFHGGTPNEFHMSIEPCEPFTDCGINFANRTSNSTNVPDLPWLTSPQQKVSDLNISPNPTQDLLNISFTEDFCYTILTIDGKTIQEKNCSKNLKASVSTRVLPSAVYVLKIEGSKEVYFQKFVKQ